MVQLVPSQCSASGLLTDWLFVVLPTAKASSGPDADTLEKKVVVGNVAVACGLTVVSTCQIDPVAALAGVVRPVSVVAPVVMVAANNVTISKRNECIKSSVERMDGR
jgi:hypothetical protein